MGTVGRHLPASLVMNTIGLTLLGFTQLYFATSTSPSGWRVHTRMTSSKSVADDESKYSPPEYMKYLQPPYMPANSEILGRMNLYNAVERSSADQSLKSFIEPVRKYREERV